MWVTSQGDPATKITHFERIGLNGLYSKSLILNRGQAFRGREGISLLMYVCYHTLAYVVLFLSNSLFFPVLIFLFHFLSFSCSLVGLLCSFLLFSFVLPFFFLLFLCTVEGPFYTACREGFLLFDPLIVFVWVQVSFQTTHWSVSCLATTTYLCQPCHIPLPDKEPYFVCLPTVAFPSG